MNKGPSLSGLSALTRGLALFFLLYFALTTPTNIRAQVLYREWIRTYHLDAAKTNQSLHILSVPDGIVVAGSSANESGDLDYLVIKYKPNGDEAWKQRYNAGPDSHDALRFLAADPAGNIFVTGTSKTVKYSKDGLFRWAAPFAGRGIAAGMSFVYVTGMSEQDFATVQLRNNDTNGPQGWFRTYDSVFTGISNISHVVTLTDSEEVLVGGGEIIVSPRSSAGLFTVVKYDVNGVRKWVASSAGHPGRTAQTRTLSIAGDGSVYILGIFDVGGEVAKFSPEGVRQWSDAPGLEEMRALALVSDQEIVFAGAGIRKSFPNQPFGWTHIFTNYTTRLQGVLTRPNGDIYAAGYETSAAGDSNMLVVKLSPNGILLATNVFDTPHHGNDAATAMVADQLGNIYVTGYSTTPEGGTEFITIKYSDGPKIETKPDGTVHLEFETTPSQPYTLQATTNFLNWQTLLTNTADTNGLVRFDDTNVTGAPYRFYRGASSP
jgi:hypothetical protein